MAAMKVMKTAAWKVEKKVDKMVETMAGERVVKRDAMKVES